MFYLCTRSKFLNETKTLDIYNLDNNEIHIQPRLKGGADTNILKDNVLAVSHTFNVHRPFFLDKNNSPDT